MSNDSMNRTRYRKIISISVALLFTAIALRAQEALTYSDCHFHLLDFLHNGEFDNTDGKFHGSEWGLTEAGRYATLPFGERGRRIEALLKGMNAANVDRVLVCGMPFIKKWSENEPFMRPKYYLDSSSRMKRARDTDITVATAILDYKRTHADAPHD